MTHYAQVTDQWPEFRLQSERLGSFSVLILDGRNTLEHMVSDALQLMEREAAAGVRIVASSRWVDTDEDSSAVIWSTTEGEK